MVVVPAGMTGRSEQYTPISGKSNMLVWNHEMPPMGKRLVVVCVCGWWGVAKLTVYGWRKDDGTVLPSPVEMWMEIF